MLRVKLDDLETSPEQLAQLDEGELCELVGILAGLEARSKAELLRRTSAAKPAESADRLLSIREAAHKLSVPRISCIGIRKNSSRSKFPLVGPCVIAKN